MAKGKVVVLRYVEGSASTTKREEGFIDAIRSNHPDIEILSDNQYGGATLEGCLSSAENLLDRFAEIDGIFAPCEPVTVAFMRTLDQSGRKADTVLVGFDASEALVDGLRKGQVDGLVVQSPFAMGERGVQLLVEILGGATVPKRVDTGCVVITKENMNDAGQRSICLIRRLRSTSIERHEGRPSFAWRTSARRSVERLRSRVLILRGGERRNSRP